MTATFDRLRMWKTAMCLSALALGLASTIVGWTVPASAASGWTSVTSGDRHTCGIRGGRVHCWGENSRGQLGDGTKDSRAVAKPIKSGANDWTSVSAGGQHSCGIRATRIACWGENGDGQLGNNSAADSFQPVLEVS